VSGSSAEKLNYEAGQDAMLTIDPTRRFKNYFLEGGPDGKTHDPLSAPITSSVLVVPAPKMGQWRVSATGAGGEKAAMGFSVNSPVSEAALASLETADLEQLFAGKEGVAYQLATDVKNLHAAILDIRRKRELFPWIMGLILVLLTAENFLANKFYRESSQNTAQVVATRS